MTTSEDAVFNDEEKEAKIKELQEIITTAEETIFSAKQLLLNLQPELAENEMPIGQTHNPEDIDGQVIYGFFDGQIMIGDDGKQYPVPANYASKSKLVEGDKLKLTITKDNRFMYKQIGPVQRNYFIGLVQKDERGNFTVKTASKEYKVLLAAATYFKVEPGDEVTLIVPQDKDTIWGAIENVLQKNATSQAPYEESATNNGDTTPNDTFSTEQAKPTPSANSPLTEMGIDDSENPPSAEEKKPTAIEKLEMEIKKERKRQSERKNKKNDSSNDIVDEWENDIEQLKQEANMPITSNN